VSEQRLHSLFESSAVKQGVAHWLQQQQQQQQQ
jgi:hypothetical protein